MNFKIILKTIGKVLVIEAILLLIPFIVSLVYGEDLRHVLASVTVAAVLALCGILLDRFLNPETNDFFAKDGLITVSLSWIALSAFGALPLVISGDIPNYIDALFETVSGFTTTGASIVDNVEYLSKSMIMWRSLTHFIGGMGVLVFLAAFTSKYSDHAMHIFRAEMPGPKVDKIMPKAKQTASVLYLIYLGLTVILVIMLLCGGMPFYDSLVHAFGTAGTGGFSMKTDGLASYSKYCQWVITIFMLLYGVNFNVYFLMLMRKFRPVLKSLELWTYLGVFVVSSAIIAFNIYSMYGSVEESIRLAAFQVSSIYTTTGYSTANFDKWPILSKNVLLALTFIGGCAGSTAGGLKISRVIILVKKSANDVKKALHPRTATSIKFEGKTLSDETVSGVTSYLLLYVLCFFVIYFLLSFDGAVAGATAFETNFSAATACFNNIGPGFAQVGPAASFSFYSPFSKIVLTFAMLLGRLELYPLIVTFSPSTWIRK